MTYKANCVRLILTLLVASLSLACSKSLDGEYNLDVPSNTAPDTRITQITVTPDATVIRIRTTCPPMSRSGCTVGVHPPGHQLAFYIMSTDRSKRFNLVDVEGMAIRPNSEKLKAGENIEFNLTFERIDNDMIHFHVIEGEAESTQGTPWHFMNVTLPKV